MSVTAFVLVLRDHRHAEEIGRLLGDIYRPGSGLGIPPVPLRDIRGEPGPGCIFWVGFPDMRPIDVITRLVACKAAHGATVCWVDEADPDQTVPYNMLIGSRKFLTVEP